MLRILTSGAALVAATSWSPPGAAKDDGRGVRIAYAAPASCPGLAFFVSRLHQGAPEARLSEEADAATRIDVEIREGESAQNGGSEYRGRLSITEPGGTSAERIVSGPSCPDLVRALAFVAVYALEAEVSVDRSPSSVGLPSPVAVSGPNRELVTRVTPPPSPARERRRALDGLLATLGMRTGLDERFAPEVGIAYERFQEATSLSPTFRVRFAYAQQGQTAVDGEWTGRLVTSALDGCAFGFGGASGTLRIAPCLRLEGGIVLGTLRSRTVSSGTLGAPWLAPGALLHGRWRFAANWLAEVDACLLLPLFRRQFLTVGDAYVLSDQRGMTPSERPLAATPLLASALYASVGWAYP